MKSLPQTSISEQLAERFASSIPAIPKSMQTLCDSLLIDTAGLCVSARHQDYLQATIRASIEPGNCSLIGHTERVNVASACLVNGTAIHGEDFDDTYEGGPIHAGAVIVPAILAAAEQHQLSGEDILSGISVGSELMCRMCTVAPKLVHKAGFHPTAVFGAIAAAAGVATALRLNQQQWVNALGIAGSMASGIIEYLAEGTWTKRMHPGWAAQSGYRAARLAQEGFTGPRTLFEGEHGFFHGFANKDDCDFTKMMAGLGEVWVSADMAFKPFACGTMAHPFIDCALELIKQGLDVNAIEKIECHTAEGILHRLWEPLSQKQNPPNGYAAKFSIPYAIAVAMIRGDAGLNDYQEEVVHDPRITTISNKITYIVDPNNPYPNQFTGHIRVTLKDGSIREHAQGFFRGGRDAPMSIDALEKKFIANCIYGGWSESQAVQSLAVLRGLRTSQVVDLAVLRAI
jgi:2-methylcitrate dehydratase PrpD